MKKEIVLFAFLLAAVECLFAQREEDRTDYIRNAVDNKIEFTKDYYHESVKLPFKEVIVFDYRFDSSKVGYVKMGNGGSPFQRLQLKENWTTIMNNYFRNNLDSTAAFSIVIVLRSFWMQKGILDEMTDKKVIEKQIFTRSDYFGTCKTMMDVYAMSGTTLKTLFRLDHTFMNYYRFKKNNLEKWFFLPFDSVADKIRTIDIPGHIAPKKNISWTQFHSFYNDRFTAPILNNQPQKGIYLTFEDFKNNKPLVAEVRVHKGKLTDELYIVNNNQEDVVAKFWGYHDGTTLFIRVGFKMHASVRQQNTFEIFGGKHISLYHNNPQQGDIRITSMSVDKKILQMDMEDGLFY